MTPVMTFARAADQAAIGRGQWGKRNGAVWITCWGCRIPVPRLLASTLISDSRPSGRDRVTEGAWMCDEPGCRVAARLRLLGYYEAAA